MWSALPSSVRACASSIADIFLVQVSPYGFNQCVKSDSAMNMLSKAGVQPTTTVKVSRIYVKFTSRMCIRTAISGICELKCYRFSLSGA